jgi:hypothetical protein
MLGADESVVNRSINALKMELDRKAVKTHTILESLSHPVLRKKAGCISYMRQRRQHI